MTEEHSLLTGSVWKKLTVFAFPLLLANILQSFYNVADMLVIGQIVGDTGLAAIGNASKLCYIINSICIGMTMGGAVLIAQYKGADDKRGQAESLQMLALLSLVFSFLVTIVSLAAYQPLFKLLNVPADAYQDTCGYMKVICWGTVFVFGYNAVCSVLKGLGDSKSPLFFVGTAAIINIVLDIILVGPLGMGTAGAAYATITAQGISFVISLFYLKRLKIFFYMEKHRKFTLHWDKLAAIVKVGLPTAIQMAVVNTAYLLVAGMLNQFGTAVSAASNVGLQINTFAGMPCWAIGQAVTAMAGQSMGAGQIDRARKVVKISLVMNVSVTLVVVIGVQLFAEPLILLFGRISPEAVNDGVYYLRVCCGINSLIYAVMYTLDSFAIGVGAANIAMMNALLDAVIVRLPVSCLLAFGLNMGFPGIYYGQALSPVLPAIASLLYFINGKWERKTLIQPKRNLRSLSPGAAGEGQRHR